MTPNEKKVMAVSIGSTTVALVLAFLLLKDCSGNSDEKSVPNNNVNNVNVEVDCGDVSNSNSNTINLNQEQLNQIIDAVSKMDEPEKTAPQRPVPQKPVPQGPVPQKPVPQNPVRPVDASLKNEVIISDKSSNAGSIVISNKETGADNKVRIEGGSENSGNIVINNGGVVNVYPKDTLKHELKKAKDTLIIKRTVIRHRRIYYR